MTNGWWSKAHQTAVAVEGFSLQDAKTILGCDLKRK
jgi:hypothetical protein